MIDKKYWNDKMKKENIALWCHYCYGADQIEKYQIRVGKNYKCEFIVFNRLTNKKKHLKTRKGVQNLLEKWVFENEQKINKD